MTNNKLFKKLLSVVLVLCMVSAWVMPAGAAVPGIRWNQVSNDRVSANLLGKDTVERDEKEPEYADSDVVRVSIFLEKAGVLDAGFPVKDLAENAEAMAYRDKLEQEQETMVQRIEKALTAQLDVVWNLTLASNLISANVQYGQIAAIKKVSGVRNVVIEEVYEPQKTEVANPNTATSGMQIGTPGSYASGYTGAGTRVAVIDTGLDLLHQSFDADAYLYALEQQAAAAGKTVEEYVTGLNLLDAEEIASVLGQLNVMERMDVSAEELYINQKVPFGFNYIDKNLNVEHMLDTKGDHGSHVAGIAAANSYIPKGDGTYAKALEEVFVQGVAPEAQVIVMKVFGAGGGAYQADYVAAIEDAILLNVDAINLSLGGGNPGLSYSTEFQAIFESLDKCGVVVSISAGNAGAWMDEVQTGAPYLYLDDVSMQTSGSPGTYTNSLGVASVDNAGVVSYYLSINGNKLGYSETLEDNNGIAYGNEALATIAGTYEYVFINGVGTPEEFAALGQDALKGKIALCFRGETSFYEKANAAIAAGAVAVLIVNNQPGTVLLNLTGYKHNAPVVSLSSGSGELFKTNAVTGNNGEVLYWTGSVEVSDVVAPVMYNDGYYTMSSFSSWGVPANLILKPEITAPGGNILSIAGAYASGTEDHVSYVAYSGTSMAAPHVTGMAALVAQYIRENDLEAKTGLSARTLAQSLLMSTAEPIHDGSNNGLYYPVLQQGAGLANVGNAVSADSYILMHEDATASYADGKVKVELLDDPDRTGSYSFSFSIYNLTGEEKEFALTADFFTQNILELDGVKLLDTKTQELTPMVTYLINGKGIEGDETMAGMDFNGDGIIDAADGQALLDHAIGKIASISNANNADLDGNGKISSYDAYLFFRQLGTGGVTVAANGQAKVTVEVTLSHSDVKLLEQFENGAYLEAFVYAESEAGTSHSIPVLGFYGNWSDPSMYDKGSYEDYILTDEETRVPYLYEEVYQKGIMNGLVMSYGDDLEREYYFGGNPIVPDATYMPERNAINGLRGDSINSVTYTCIRTAVGGMIWVKDANGEIIDFGEFGYTPSAYYYTNGGKWQYTYWDDPIGYVPELQDNTLIEVGITLANEYYRDADGNINWAALGKGADLSMKMVVDNTAPVINSVNLDKDSNKLVVDLVDNQYIAAVVLLNSDGDHVYLKEGSQADAKAGVATQYALDVSEVNGASFLLQVYDYAMNCTTYEITTQIGEITDRVDKVVVSDSEVILQLDQTHQLTANVLPVNTINRDVVWSSQNPRVATVDENGLVTAHDVGRTRIVATSAANGKIKGSCMVEVIDVAADLNGIVWDENGDMWLAEFNTTDLKNFTHIYEDALEGDEFVAATMGPDGTLYLSSMNSSTGKGALYTLNERTKQPVKLTDCALQGKNGPIHIFFSDLTYVPAMFGTGALLGLYGPYVIALDPETGEAIGAIDSFEDENGDYVYLLGIAGSYGTYEKVGSTWVYQDYVYIITEHGEIIAESYYGYEKNGKKLVAAYSYVVDEPREVYQTSVDTGDAWYYNSAYYDGTNLYWAAFDQDNDDRVTLYAFDESYREYNLGDFGKDVWPVCGLYRDAAELENNRVNVEHEVLDIDEKAMQMHEVQKIEMKKHEAAMQLQTMSQTDVRNVEEAEFIQVEITAKDAVGANVASTNGIFTVTYDPSKLTLKDVAVHGDFVSVMEKDGAVTVGYVAVNGLDADDAIATLEFIPLTSEATAVTVTFDEVNNTAPNYKDQFDVECPHDKTELRNEKAPTCTEPGYSGDLYCAICGTLLDSGKTVEATGHNYQNGQCVNCGECKHEHTQVIPGKEATCTEPGLTEGKKCADCGEVLVQQETIPAKGHTEEVIPGKEATCTESGLTEGKKCSVCGEILVKQETIPAKGHTEEIIPGKEATCTESGLTEGKKCSVCGDILVKQETIAAKGHSYGNWYMEKAATCTEDGSMRHDCANCDHYETGLIPAMGHEYKDGKCIRCGEKDPDYVPVCEHENTEIRGAKAATCTEEGYTGDTYCADCGELIAAGTKTAAKGHTEEIIPGKEATCTEAGLTEGKKCSVCGEILVKQETIEAKGHTEEIIPGKEATCTEPGLTEGKKCADCGEILVKQEEIPAKGHNYENGSCTDCGEKDPDFKEVIGKLGDLNGDGLVNSSDVSVLFRYVSKDPTLGELTAEQELLADVNQDGTVNSSDVSILFRYVSKDATLVWEPKEITT